MRRLAASGLLPQRAGQPVKVWVHISLAELLAMQGSTALVQAWVTQMRAAWAAHRAAASAGGGDLGAWLDGQAAAAVACDAAMAPYVTGDVNAAVLDDLVRLCTQLGRLRHGAAPGDDSGTGASDTGGADGTGTPAASASTGGGGESGQPAPVADPDAERAREALEQAIIGAAIDLLSGPGGLASYLRRHQLGGRLGGPSVPLDIGYSQSVPAGIRNAVMLRAGHCEWSGGCSQPASACEVHHVRHKKNGGQTSTKDCALLCFFHHQVMIHRRGWTLVLNPDGTTTAWNPGKTKVLHSHGPPARAG